MRGSEAFGDEGLYALTWEFLGCSTEEFGGLLVADENDSVRKGLTPVREIHRRHRGMSLALQEFSANGSGTKVTRS
jgi:hypothetical protein